MYDVKQYKINAGASIAIPVLLYNWIRCFQSPMDKLHLTLDSGVGGLFPAGVAVQVGDDTRATLTNQSDTTINIEIGFSSGQVLDDRMTLTNDVSIKNASGDILKTAIRGGGTGFTYTETTIGTSAVKILSADTTRTSAIIKSGNGDVWLGTSSVTAGDIPTIDGGQSLTIGHTGEVWAIRKSGSDKIGVYVEQEI